MPQAHGDREGAASGLGSLYLDVKGHLRPSAGSGLGGAEHSYVSHGQLASCLGGAFLGRQDARMALQPVSRLGVLGVGGGATGLGKQVGSTRGTQTGFVQRGPWAGWLGSPPAQMKCNLPSSSSLVVIYLSGRCSRDRNSGLHIAVCNEGKSKQKRD